MARTSATKSSASWTSEDETKILRMRESGASFSTIAKALGRSQASVESRYTIIKKRDKVACGGAA